MRKDSGHFEKAPPTLAHHLPKPSVLPLTFVNTMKVFLLFAACVNRYREYDSPEEEGGHVHLHA